MIKVEWGNSLWRLVADSDTMTKFVLLILLVMSIICWAVFFYKLVLLRIKRKHLREVSAYIKNVQSFDDVRTMAARFAHTIPGYFLAQNISFLRSLLGAEEKTILSEQEADLVQSHLDQTLDEVIHQEETYLPILSTCGEVATLLGLFGTVWGLVHSFVSIANEQQADITTIAPGIAEALITTLAGLMVAIPALVMFHYLNAKVRAMEHTFVQLADTHMLLMRKWFLNEEE